MLERSQIEITTWHISISPCSHQPFLGAIMQRQRCVTLFWWPSCILEHSSFSLLPLLPLCSIFLWNYYYIIRMVCECDYRDNRCVGFKCIGHSIRKGHSHLSSPCFVGFFKLEIYKSPDNVTVSAPKLVWMSPNILRVQGKTLPNLFHSDTEWIWEGGSSTHPFFNNVFKGCVIL